MPIYHKRSKSKTYGKKYTKKTKKQEIFGNNKIRPSINDFSQTLLDNIFFFSLFDNSFKKETDT